MCVNGETGSKYQLENRHGDIGSNFSQSINLVSHKMAYSNLVPPPSPLSLLYIPYRSLWTSKSLPALMNISSIISITKQVPRNAYIPRGLFHHGVQLVKWITVIGKETIYIKYRNIQIQITSNQFILEIAFRPAG